MKKYLYIKGKSLMDSKGKSIGYIDDFVVDARRKVIYSYIVKSKSFFGRSYIIPLKEVKKKKYVFMTNCNKVKVSGKTIKKHKDIFLSNYINKELKDLEEKYLGVLHDVVFDEDTGEIKALSVCHSFLDDFFDGRDVILVDNRIVFKKNKIVVEDKDISIKNKVSIKNILG